MSLSLELIPGKIWVEGEELTIDKLNQTARPTVNLVGSLGSLSLSDGAVTTAKLADNALSANATGRGKMQDAFFAADAASRAKFAAAFLGAGDAASLAIFADGFWTANAAGRAKMADGFVTGLQLAASAAAVISSCRNLVVSYASAATATVAADEVLLKNTDNKPWLALAVSLTVNIGLGVALNGLETGGTENTSHWYYLWLISDGTNVRAVLEDAGSDSSSAQPAGPDLSGGAFAGYTYKALVGAVRNDGSSNFVAFYQRDREIWFNETALFTDKAAAVASTYESYQAGGGGSDVDLRTLIPPNAIRLRGNAGTSNSGQDFAMALAADASGLGAQVMMGSRIGGVSFNSFSGAAPFLVLLKTAQTFYWKAHNTNAHNRVTLTGYML